MEGSCGQKSLAAREGCCSCEGGSRMQVLEGGGGLMTGAELTKTGLRNAAAQDGIPAHGMRHNGCHSKQQTRCNIYLGSFNATLCGFNRVRLLSFT